LLSLALWWQQEEKQMANDGKDGIDRRGMLECMVWAGTGVLWTMVGGVPRSSSLLGMSEATAQARGFTFLQISDSHIGFKQAANPNPLRTLEEAIAKADALPQKPAFMIHTGDITHLSRPEEFDNADQVIRKAKLDTFYVPGEHDIIDETPGTAYMERYGQKTKAKGTGWYSFDRSGVHFVGLVNVANLKAGGMGALGAEQLTWLADDLKGKSASTPIVLFAHIPFWTVSAEWGWGTDDSVQALALVKRFGSVTVLNGHIHQIMQKVEGTVTFHTARSTAFPQPAPGTAPSPGPLKVPDDRLRSVLGIATIAVKQGTQPLAITDSDLTKV
jgi:Calcineurin-like phosphoesterase